MTETLKIKYFVEKADPWAQAQTEGWDLFAVRVLVGLLSYLVYWST